MAVTDDRLVAGRDLVELCRAVARGGATCLQIRLKTRPPRELAELVRAVVAGVAIPVLVNDRVDVALAAGAAGVHLGPDDAPVARTRAIVPPEFLVGASVGGPAEAPGGAEADYWGVGPWRTTVTKSDAGDALGPAGFAAVVRLAAGRPCLAIGGVRPEDVAEVLAAGGSGVAAASGLFAEPDAEEAARRYAAAFPDRR
jgi:thiamine-phosphate pyrophosphorylase